MDRPAWWYEPDEDLEAAWEESMLSRGYTYQEGKWYDEEGIEWHPSHDEPDLDELDLE